MKMNAIKKMRVPVLAVVFAMILAGCAADQETAETADETNIVSSADAENDMTDSTDESTGGDETASSASDAEDQESNILILTVNGIELTAVLEENSSVSALLELLSDGPLTIDMRDYGNMEKVGAIGTDLPRNDEQITTEAGDLILYQGNAFVIYYATNSWNFTRLGKIQDIAGDELKELLGNGDVSEPLSLPDQQ